MKMDINIASLFQRFLRALRDDFAFNFFLMFDCDFLLNPINSHI